MTEKIIFVDDEISVLKSLNRLFLDEPYDLIFFNNPSEALKEIEKNQIAVVISDQSMPEMKGTSFLQKVKELSPETVRIILTGYADTAAAMAAINQGSVFRFICKPWVNEELKLTIRQAIEHYNLVTQNKKWSQLTQKQNEELSILNQNLEAIVDERTRQLVQSKDILNQTLTNLQETLNGVIQAIALIVEIRDPYTAGHQQRVSDLASAIAGEMGFSQDRIDGIRMSALIHDIGKIVVPAEFLSKPGRLSDLEFSMMKAHPKVGCDILKGIDFSCPVADIVMQHHERLDGSGYPGGLFKEEILIEARIVAVADVVEAMASHRPYRPALGIPAALDEISNKSGILYDTTVVDACLRLFQKKDFGWHAPLSSEKK